MRLSVATALVLCAAAVAQANPRETMTFTNVNSDGVENVAANVIETRTLVGGYGVSKIRVNGTLTAVSPFTYESEAVFKVTPPGAAPFYVQMSGVQASFTSVTFTNVDLYLPTPLAASAGTWEVRFFEGYDDGGVDARWDTLAITLDDAPVGYTEQGDAGSTVDTAQVPAGTGAIASIIGSIDGDEDLYRIQICDPANFVATTVGGAAFDSRLFLFSADGHGVLFNDDYEAGPDEYYLQSRIHNPGTLTAGDYYIGISAFQRMAVNASNQALWNNTPYETVRAPDGPGAATPFTGWTGTQFEDGGYIIILSGACFVATGPECGNSDFNGDDDFGTDQDILAFFACLGGNCCPTCWHNGSDFNGDGDYGTDQDIEAFFRVLAGHPC
jgi:hypothetical protein